MKRKHGMMFFDAPDDSGGAAALLGGVDDVTPQDNQQQTAVVTPVTPVTPAPAFDPKALATEFGSVLRETLGQQQGQQKTALPPMTPEEAKKALNFFEIDDNFMAEFGDLEKQKGALERYRDGIVRMVDTIMQARLQETQSQIDSRYSPVMTQFQQHQAEQARGRFHEAYPALKNPALAPLLTAVTQSLESSGKTFANEGEAFKALAEGVEAVMKQSNPEFTLTSASAGGQQTKAPTRSIPTTTPGGGGGGGAGGGGTKATGALGILGPVRG